VGQVLAMQPFDHLVRRPPPGEIGVMPVAPQDLAAGGGMRADPPATGSWQLYFRTI